jgi:hypothetical protein
MEFGLAVFIIILYFVPALSAKGKPHAQGVLVVNLFLGWTGIGWLIALIWGCSGEQRKCNDRSLRKCWQCAEYIGKEAQVCPHCAAR